MKASFSFKFDFIIRTSINFVSSTIAVSIVIFVAKCNPRKCSLFYSHTVLAFQSTYDGPVLKRITLKRQTRDREDPKVKHPTSKCHSTLTVASCDYEKISAVAHFNLAILLLSFKHIKERDVIVTKLIKQYSQTGTGMMRFGAVNNWMVGDPFEIFRACPVPEMTRLATAAGCRQWTISSPPAAKRHFKICATDR